MRIPQRLDWKITLILGWSVNFVAINSTQLVGMADIYDRNIENAQEPQEQGMMSCFSTTRIQEAFTKIHLSSHAKIQVAGGNELARFPTFATTYWQEW